MPISWYASKPKQGAEVKLTKSSIVLTSGGVAKLLDIDPRFDSTSHVKLGWDPDLRLIAIAPAQDGDKDTFKFARRGRGQSNRTINAVKFFEVFNLNADGATLGEPYLQNVEGAAGFSVRVSNLDSAAGTGDAPMRRKRGPKPKVAA